MRVVVCALLLMLLTACGSGASDAEPASSPDEASSSNGAGADDGNEETAPEQDSTEAGGTPAPSALTNFQCRADDDGDWSASGNVKNTTKDPVTFQVTVLLRTSEGDDSASHKATTKEFESIQPKGSMRLEMKDLKAPKDAEGCYVRVLALDK